MKESREELKKRRDRSKEEGDVCVVELKKEVRKGLGGRRRKSLA